ncbi:unnamed protein product [Nesidiocoris tenuis]|uniref:Uncharacterized protein n=1 Tax=Nesidiocoris tenuis TaxID=355587 RepID=A0A6H5HKC6_9HEMI|nr:unnamed protein product [Nesidiocoris tenuis]
MKFDYDTCRWEPVRYWTFSMQQVHRNIVRASRNSCRPCNYTDINNQKHCWWTPSSEKFTDLWSYADSGAIPRNWPEYQNGDWKTGMFLHPMAAKNLSRSIFLLGGKNSFFPSLVAFNNHSSLESRLNSVASEPIGGTSSNRRTAKAADTVSLAMLGLGYELYPPTSTENTRRFSVTSLLQLDHREEQEVAMVSPSNEWKQQPNQPYVLPPPPACAFITSGDCEALLRYRPRKLPATLQPNATPAMWDHLRIQ